MSAPLHRPREAFLSRACAKGNHSGCAKLNCTCFCHQNVYERLAELMDACNWPTVLAILGLPLYHDG